MGDQEPPRTPQLDDYWYGVRCIGCQQFLHYTHDAKGADSGIAFVVHPEAWLELTCGGCGRKARYRLKYLEKRQLLVDGWGPIVERLDPDMPYGLG